MSNPGPKLDRIADLLAEILAELRKANVRKPAEGLDVAKIVGDVVVKRGPGRPKKVD